MHAALPVYRADSSYESCHDAATCLYEGPCISQGILQSLPDGKYLMHTRLCGTHIIQWASATAGTVLYLIQSVRTGRRWPS